MSRMRLFFFLLSISQIGYTQVLYSGRVTDNQELPLLGATVLIEGKSTAVVTDFNGFFEIESDSGASLLVSYIGFESQSIMLGDNKSLEIRLIQKIEELDQIVVIGYGTSEKKDLTGSIKSIKSEEIMLQPALTPIQSIQGKAAGIQISNSGEPGAQPVVRIRGLGTVLSGRNPLYVVDGIISNRIDNLSSADILSIDILKDASSLSIYGNRGANGVIIITTKSGSTQETNILYSSYVGFKGVLSKVQLADANSFSRFSNQAFGFDRFPILQNNSTDWFDTITQLGIVTEHNLSVSGGSEKFKTYFSVNLYDEQGIVKGSEYNRLNTRIKNSYAPNDKLSFKTNLSLSLNKNVPKPNSAFTEAYKQSPNIPAQYDEGLFTGRYGVPFDDYGKYNNVGNPLARVELFNELNKDLIIQANIEGNYHITNSLDLTSNFNIETNYLRNREFTSNRENWLAVDPSRQFESYKVLEPNAANNTLKITKENNYNWIWNAFLSYKKTFNENHSIKAVLGISMEKGQGDDISATRNNVLENENLFSISNGESGTDVTGGTLKNLKTLQSFFARIQYSFKNNYLATFTLRRDGSSAFGGSQSPWGNFPSVGLGWVVSNETFLRESKTINFLKIRASWGELGNQDISLNTLTAALNLGYPFGSSQSVQSGATVTKIIDSNLGWEVTREFDLGLEFALFDNRLNGEFDYYDRVNTNVILGIDIPNVFGNEGIINTHVGEVSNKGAELSLNWNGVIQKDFKYSVGGNVSYNKNLLNKISNPLANFQRGGDINNGHYTKKLALGEPLGSFYLYEVIGYDNRGNFVFDDVNNNTEVDEGDRKYFGSYLAPLSFGLNTGISFRNWDFNIAGHGSALNKIYNGKKAQRFGGENIEQNIANNSFSQGNTTANNPAPSNLVPISSSYYLESGDFFRIDNITFGYTFKEINDIKKVRIYLAAQNPIIFKRFSGYTPELPGDGDPMGNYGIELDVHPSVRSILFGINIDF